MTTVTKIGIDGPTFVMDSYFVANYVKPIEQAILAHRYIEFHIFDRPGVCQLAYELVSVLHPYSKIFIHTSNSTVVLRTKEEKLSADLHVFVHHNSDVSAKAYVVARVSFIIDIPFEIDCSQSAIDLTKPRIREIAAELVHEGSKDLWPKPWVLFIRPTDDPTVQPSKVSGRQAAEQRSNAIVSVEPQNCTTFDDPPTPISHTNKTTASAAFVAKKVGVASTSNKRTIDLISEEAEEVDDNDVDVDSVAKLGPSGGSAEDDDANECYSDSKDETYSESPSDFVTTDTTTTTKSSKVVSSTSSTSQSSKATVEKRQRSVEGSSIDGAPVAWSKLTEFLSIISFRRQNGDNDQSYFSAANSVINVLEPLLPGMVPLFARLKNSSDHRVLVMRTLAMLLHATSSSAIDPKLAASTAAAIRGSLLNRLNAKLQKIRAERHPTRPSAEEFAKDITEQIDSDVDADGDGVDEVREKKFQYMVAVGMLINVYGAPQDQTVWLSEIVDVVSAGRACIKQTPLAKAVSIQTLRGYIRLAKRFAKHPQLEKVVMNGAMCSAATWLTDVDSNVFDDAAVLAIRGINAGYMWYTT